MVSRAVVKFGGADLSTGEKIRKAAQKVVNSGIKEVVVVVSAMGKTTDNLIEYISNLGKISDAEYADIVSMGERTSARLFSAALRSLGVESVYFDPSEENWPIITNSNYLDAEPDLERTRSLVKRYIEPLLGKCIPVVCGFLGKDLEGRVTTLGRGGSDTTAILLGNCLEADEVILVKETEGVLSADPRVVPEAKPLENITVEEMFTLAKGGAKVVRSESLRYKLPNQKLRVVSFSAGSIREGGTEIIGVFNSGKVETHKFKGLTAITVIGDINPKSVGFLLSKIEDNPLYGISTGRSSLTIFLMVQDVEKVLREIHNIGVFKALSHRCGVGMIGLSHPDFVNSPGWVARISGALASKGINILEVTSSKSTINIFIDEGLIEEAILAVGDVVEV
ncbi:MAG: aspartate kinase [Candidatus Bathyarchaeia archaeon]